MQLKPLIEKWREYSELSNLGIIARRKFFNNAFDGALTCAGIVSGSFIIFLSDTTQSLSSAIIIITGLSTALAIGISGLWGAFLSEEAERKKKLRDLKKEMGIYQEEKEKSEKIDRELDKNHKKKKILAEHEEIQKAMITPINYKSTMEHTGDIAKEDDENNKKNKSLIERSERFATIVASLVDGGAPVLGSVLPLIPFFFGPALNIFHFLVSYSVLVCILAYLGIFLGQISGGGRLKYTLHLITAGVTTLLVSLLLELALHP
ncbi:MAG TPA: VIT1/CCC1 transporter family protein [Candidatus Nanopelagicaceae bacterium]|nr:VIT1/CCC1 transporter family protein [Candidatus Nanopelagicaceae bacterium]